MINLSKNVSKNALNLNYLKTWKSRDYIDFFESHTYTLFNTKKQIYEKGKYRYTSY